MRLVDAVKLAAELPDPGKPSTIALAGTLGAFVGALIAERRKLPSSSAGDLTRRGMVVGTGAGLMGWLTRFATDLL
jgi:hypothetical protein